MAFDMASLAPKLTRRERDATRHKLAKERANHIVGHLCALTRLALSEGRILTPLAYEALFRQVIRSELCLQGWKWHPADQIACDLVGVVLSILQAKRPSWNEGQPEWTIERGTLIERTRCANCGNPLPEGRPKFCCDGCKRVYNMRLLRLREASEEQMRNLASRSEL
jgi:hypothetical protein